MNANPTLSSLFEELSQAVAKGIMIHLLPDGRSYGFNSPPKLLLWSVTPDAVGWTSSYHFPLFADVMKLESPNSPADLSCQEKCEQEITFGALLDLPTMFAAFWRQEDCRPLACRKELSK